MKFVVNKASDLKIIKQRDLDSWNTYSVHLFAISRLLRANLETWVSIVSCLSFISHYTTAIDTSYLCEHFQ